MMIGPAPMIRMLWMSVRLGTLSAHRRLLAAQGFVGDPQLRLQPPQHQVIEAFEQRAQLVRTGTRLRMALEAERGTVLKRDALQRPIEQRAMRRAHAFRERCLVDREPVVLTGNEDAAGIEFLHGMVRAMVAEFHLHGASASGESEDLMSETDAEHRQIRLEKGARRRDGVVTRLRVTGSVGEKYAVRLEGECLLGAGLRGYDGHAAAAVGEQAQDVALDAEVVGHDVQALLRADWRARAFGPEAPLVPLEAPLGAPHLGELDRKSVV